MPKGPQGQKRPADVIGNAVLIGRIATGEVEDKKRDTSALSWMAANPPKKRGPYKKAAS
jgi:hypothetical protein